METSDWLSRDDFSSNHANSTNTSGIISKGHSNFDYQRLNFSLRILNYLNLTKKNDGLFTWRCLKWIYIQEISPFNLRVALEDFRHFWSVFETAKMLLPEMMIFSSIFHTFPHWLGYWQFSSESVSRTLPRKTKNIHFKVRARFFCKNIVMRALTVTLLIFVIPCFS